DALFSSDDDVASVSWTRYADINQYGYTYSLFASYFLAGLTGNNQADLRKLFPRGLPTTGDLGHDFLLEKATDWIGTQATHMPQPFLGYFHLLPPHGPYNTELEFYNRFKDDGFTAIDKSRDAFTQGISRETLLKRRTNYDEYILYVDREFGRLYDALEKSGMLKNSWVVLTSDHGEMFERGIEGHATDVLYEPVIRIPLLIFEPGRDTRADIYSPTSAVDLLPTLAHLTGHPIPEWTEGMLLPPYADGNTGLNRNIYVVKATEIDQNAPLTRASTTLVKGRYKLLYFFGYPEFGVNKLVQLYDLQADPEELVDLSGLQKDVTAELLNELQSKLKDVNKPYI
ncbi:MAG TPA: sulfatase-like hydrolase/transferase, partial [Terriglobales bacterium]|nr:sulfatase-like hydrolase/transferase [Terriglobales bacterium]